MDLEFCPEQSSRFLELIEPDTTKKFLFVAVLKDEHGKRLKAVNIHSTFKEARKRLSYFNGKGYEIFVTINDDDGSGRRANDNIKTARACFVDSDNGSINGFRLKPSLIVRSKRGEHAYWLLQKTNDMGLFSKCQRGLIGALKTDASIVDPARCMRLPGFFNHTVKTEPFLVTFKQVNASRYHISEIMEAYPENKKAFAEQKQSSGSGTDEKLDWLDLARLFADADSLRDGFVYWGGRFFRYCNTHYQDVDDRHLRASALRFLQHNHKKVASQQAANQIVAQLTAIGLVDQDLRPPCFLNGLRSPTTMISVQNGLLNLESLMAKKSDALMAHTPDYFSPTCLPYHYDPNAKCPEWTRFLKRIQPDKNVRRLLQEWVGYNLIHDTKLEKMLLFVGDGANGKTVFCTVMKELLGIQNVSSVPLEQFDVSRPYQLAETVGKIANIHEEFSGHKRISEGILKQMVTGTTMTFERKNRDPFSAKPTARLTFCSNELPRFNDRSAGLWRRLIIVPFDVKIPASEQRPEYQDGAWWIERGEMAGILNWALRGLMRIWERGKFKEPAKCMEIKKSYREDANQTGVFLQQHCVFDKGARTGATTLYKAYCEYMKQIGEHRLSTSNFAEEIRKHLNVKRSDNAAELDGTRQRYWLNLKYQG